MEPTLTNMCIRQDASQSKAAWSHGSLERKQYNKHCTGQCYAPCQGEKNQGISEVVGEIGVPVSWPPSGRVYMLAKEQSTKVVGEFSNSIGVPVSWPPSGRVYMFARLHCQQ